jgi:cyclic beta-1,2-glucan synthetase
LPGVRENGGQYTHAAIWTLMAFAALGDGNTAGDLFSILNPINRGKSGVDINRYKGEPYVMAADVYAEFPHVGRCGWTWYTGSSGWMYRAGLESILGFRLRDKKLFLDPCIPSGWPGFELSFRHLSSRYELIVENPKSVCRGVQTAQMDGKPIRALEGILLIDDGGEHRIRVVLG